MCLANGVQLSHFISHVGEGSNPSQDGHVICSIPLNFITELVQNRKHYHWMDIFNPSIIEGFTFHWCRLTCLPIPVAMRSKVWDWGCSLTGIADSNPAGGMDVRLLWVLCVVSLGSLRRTIHSSSGVLVCCVSECDCTASIMRRPWPTRGCCVMGKEMNLFIQTSPLWHAQVDRRHTGCHTDHITIACVVLTKLKFTVPITELLGDHGSRHRTSCIHRFVILQIQTYNLQVAHSMCKKFLF